jgi:hypothetical protein
MKATVENFILKNQEGQQIGEGDWKDAREKMDLTCPHIHSTTDDREGYDTYPITQCTYNQYTQMQETLAGNRKNACTTCHEFQQGVIQAYISKNVALTDAE